MAAIYCSQAKGNKNNWLCTFHSGHMITTFFIQTLYIQTFILCKRGIRALLCLGPLLSNGQLNYVTKAIVTSASLLLLQ